MSRRDLGSTPCRAPRRGEGWPYGHPGGTAMTSWSRRLSNAETRQALRTGLGPDDADDGTSPLPHGRRHDDGAIDEGPIMPDTGSRNRAEDGLTGEQVRTILTDTLVETPDMVAI